MKRPAGGNRDDVGDAGALEGVDIGAIVDRRRREPVAPAVTGQEHRFGRRRCGRSAERRTDRPRASPPFPRAGPSSREIDRRRIRRSRRQSLWSCPSPPSCRTIKLALDAQLCRRRLTRELPRNARASTALERKSLLSGSLPDPLLGEIEQRRARTGKSSPGGRSSCARSRLGSAAQVRNAETSLA